MNPHYRGELNRFQDFLTRGTCLQRILNVAAYAGSV